jgi:hypothetical protein
MSFFSAPHGDSGTTLVVALAAFVPSNQKQSGQKNTRRSGFEESLLEGRNRESFFCAALLHVAH